MLIDVPNQQEMYANITLHQSIILSPQAKLMLGLQERYDSKLGVTRKNDDNHKLVDWRESEFQVIRT